MCNKILLIFNCQCTLEGYMDIDVGVIISKWICSGKSLLSNQCKIKVKVKLSLCFNWAPHHEDILGSGGIVPRILDLGIWWRWVVSFTPRPLHPQGNSPWYPSDRRLGGLQSRSGRGSEEKNSQPLPGLEPPIIRLVAQRYTTELSRLLV
jgi:hypothetical protein